MCAKGLATLIRTNNNFNVIVTPCGEDSIRLIQHADDTTLFASNDCEFPVICDILNVYCKGSGSKLKVNKSKGLCLGKWRNRTDNPCNFTWCKKKKILGIVIGNEVTPEDKWGPRINKTKCILDKWSTRNLTLNKKAVIVNTLVGGWD